MNITTKWNKDLRRATCDSKATGIMMLKPVFEVTKFHRHYFRISGLSVGNTANMEHGLYTSCP